MDVTGATRKRCKIEHHACGRAADLIRIVVALFRSEMEGRGFVDEETAEYIKRRPSTAALVFLVELLHERQNYLGDGCRHVGNASERDNHAHERHDLQSLAGQQILQH